MTNVYLGSEAGFADVFAPVNEIVKTYSQGSSERASLQSTLQSMACDEVELCMMINGNAIETGEFANVVAPHNHQKVIARAHLASNSHVHQAIDACRSASKMWADFDWKSRAAIFLKAADLAAGPWRNKLNAATMLGQSKTVHQAEIDSAAELIDFFRWNVAFMQSMYAEQPVSAEGEWNRIDYRPLEGFVYAVTPFNFTAIAANLPCAPALLGNVVVWKPSAGAMLSANVVMALLREAGLPDGVINLVNGDPVMITKELVSQHDFAGVHFTGSTAVFDELSRQIASHIGQYKSYPRVVGETGGKNFVLVHPSANVPAVATALIRGAFEYQGQKCSAASRVFVPQSLWPKIKEVLCDLLPTIGVGDVADFKNFMGAVIDTRAFRKHQDAIQKAKTSSTEQIIAGGQTDDEYGYFVYPTVIQTTDSKSTLLTEELFGPIMAIFVFPDSEFTEIVDNIDHSSVYGLTGAIFSQDRSVIASVSQQLRYAAGNFYINDKPTGAVVGRQPFGGARASGTNDKAGSLWNLTRWVSPRTIKENFAPPTDYRYAFLS